MIRDLVLQNRSYRRFDENQRVTTKVLEELVDLGKLSASAANKQPLRYILSSNEAKNEEIFSCLNWAGYLTEWTGPETGERPAAYIIIVAAKSDYCQYDAGIAAQTILLGASDIGLGGCMIASLDREKLRKIILLDSEKEILLVLAIGKPKENVAIVEIGAGEDIKYWRDESSKHFVPKIKLKDIIINSFS